ncbi:MAG: TIGR01906 family membrane protein [Anaerolineae bacterium]|nr:TIGR01906 family membrane protein [Anaerolineae bacterium]
MTSIQETTSRRLPSAAMRVSQILIGLALPIALILSNVFLIATDAFIRHEYDKPSFPADEYYPPGGYPLPRAEREALARLGLASVLRADGIRLLEEARFERTGEPAFNEREIRHMRDVNVLIQKVRWVWWIAWAVLVGEAVLLLVAGERRALFRALWVSSAASLIAFAALGLFIGVGFNIFFTAFHRVFFEGDTWLFLYSDTLIRIYPTKFWFDVSVYLAGMTLAELGLIAAGSRVALRRAG